MAREREREEEEEIERRERERKKTDQLKIFTAMCTHTLRNAFCLNYKITNYKIKTTKFKRKRRKG